MPSLLKAKKKRTDPRGGRGVPLSDLPVSPPKTRIEPHIFILRASRLIICKHLRHCGAANCLRLVRARKKARD